MRLASLLSVVVLFAASLLPAQAATPFQPADKLFTVTFPVAPETREDTVPGKAGATYKRVSYAAEGAKHFVLVGVLYVADGPELTAQEQAALLDGTAGSMQAMPGFVAAPGGAVTPVTVDGRTGRQIRGTANGAGFNARMFVTGRNLFMVQGVYAPDDAAAKAAAEAFIASFHFAR